MSISAEALATVVDLARPRINGKAIQQLCAEGRWRPTRHRVLLEALWETDGGGVIVETAKKAGIGHRAREAIAFVVRAIGPEVPDCGFAVGDIVTHNSAAGDPVDHVDEACPYWTVHFEDITGVAG